MRAARVVMLGVFALWLGSGCEGEKSKGPTSGKQDVLADVVVDVVDVR